MNFKICYIWIDKFRNFEKFGVNLSSSEKFDFDFDNFRLVKTEVNNVLNNFFGDHISEVSAFIGKNGTGKSNLLELVCKLVKGGKTSVESDFFIITKNNDQYECHFRLENFRSIESSFPIEFIPYSGDIDDLKVIYFSNVYDERNHIFSSKVSDLSANNRYSKRAYKRKTSDFVKQFQFIRSELFRESEIPTPEKVILTPKYNVHNSSYWNQSFFSDSTLNEKFTSEYKNYFRDLQRLKPSENKLNYFFIYVLISEVISLVKNLVNEDSFFDSDITRITTYLVDDIEQIKNTYKSKHDIAKLWKDWCRRVIHELYTDYFKDTVKTNRKASELENLANGNELIDKFQDFIKTKDLVISTEGSRNRKTESYILDFNESSIKLDQDYYNFIDWSRKLNLDWLGLSSGQKAYLDIFSLLRFDLKNIKTDNVLICIDEGDLYLHPKWQADFFYKLVNLTPKFKSANYQFVLTSHSPFLVSDLPKQNLVFLGGNSENYSDIVNKNNSIKTFGGNLGELYIDAFFMEGGLISRFAADKMQTLIDKINSNLNLNQQDEKLIEIIGDEFIKIQIQNLRSGKNR